MPGARTQARTSIVPPRDPSLRASPMPARRWPQREGQCVGLSFFDLGSAGGPAPHVLLLLEPPRLPLVAGFLATPGEGVVLDVVERPAQLAALGVLAPEDDAIPLDP